MGRTVERRRLKKRKTAQNSPRKNVARPIRLFCSDLDGTLLGNPEGTQRFCRAWLSVEEKQRPLLCYASGRLLHEQLDLLPRTGLPNPDYLIGGVGTEIYDFKRRHLLKDFSAQFSDGWDREAIERVLHRFPGAAPQPPEYLTEHKSSWYLNRASPAEIRELKRRLRDAGVEVNIVYSSLRDLDILPKRANKGHALRWLLDKLELESAEALVAGDSGNDSSMFLLPNIRGIVVENSQPELYEAVVELPVFCANSVLADGVVEGLLHHGLISQKLGPDEPLHQPILRPPAIARLAEVAHDRPLDGDELALISEGYERAVDALRRNVTPIGFSACSMADNEVTGTDLNYRSVWARDGAMTILYSLDLDDREIRDTQRRTLRTLFDHLSPTGQVPANVRIDDETPDYSGIGGVCAIDAPLWAIIAFYHFVRVTREFELLDEYAERLEQAMAWVGAHDGNNNGLLEIPEAGDWTDLFGRSYEVLYDEILWYRANVCYARLLERRGEFTRAAEYLQRSQRTRGQILAQFWPSTKLELGGGRTFADQQFFVGDARYLLAEITPFSFSWRCDVLGNVLAFLFGVLDVERAQIAFRFMWGVGVNDPFPVANLYPVVQAGDPDWRPYYIVNLQNLPHHYHNGGIWPFIGGMWVRFVHRLGLHDLASRELFRLGEANRAGKLRTWEFNEWLHGATGRPMGKCYQAWSAASYVRACHELGIGLPKPKDRPKRPRRAR